MTPDAISVLGGQAQRAFVPKAEVLESSQCLPSTEHRHIEKRNIAAASSLIGFRESSQRDSCAMIAAQGKEVLDFQMVFPIGEVAFAGTLIETDFEMFDIVSGYHLGLFLPVVVKGDNR